MILLKRLFEAAILGSFFVVVFVVLTTLFG